MIRRFSRVMTFVVALSLLQGVLSFSSPVAVLAAVAGPSGFVSGQWLIVVQQAATADSFAELKLKAESGKQWEVVIADVTNTGTDTKFDASKLRFGSISAGMSDGVAPASFLPDAKGLSTAKLDAVGSVTIADSATERVAIAYSVGEIAKGEAALIFGDQALPLESAFVDKLSAANLEVPKPLVIGQATVQEVSVAGALTVALDTGASKSIKMSGVKTPGTEGCFGPEAAAAVTNLSGGTVWVQDDPSGEGSLVWYWDANVGGLALLNKTLLAEGFGGFDGAQAGALNPWLEQTGILAKATGTGLWAVCKNADGVWINPPAVAAAPTAEPTAVPDKRAQYEWIDARDLVIRPGTFEGKKIAVSGTVFNIQVEKNVTFMQIYLDGTNREAAVIGYLGDSTGIYEGTYVTVYGTGRGTFEGTNGFGGTIVQPLLRADIVDF